MMKRKPSSRKDEHNVRQWDRSKDEFWSMVKGEVEPPPGCIVNIGCGYDRRFVEFEKQGYLFVNFDLVCIDVIHHESEQLHGILAAFHALLKPGGRLFLEDPNAWGMFQMAKSILLPRPVYRLLRSTYHHVKRSSHRPAEYEFPTSVWKVRKLLREVGFSGIRLHPNESYPCVGPSAYAAYRVFRKIEYVKTYHNYHYMLSAEKV
jgi:SAM-dependent methyltransferase